MSFTLQDAVLALKPVNDDELLNIAMSLPGNFAYVLNELHMNFQQNRAVDWNSNAVLIISNYGKNQKNLDMRIPIEMAGFSNTGVSNDSKALIRLAGTLWRTPIQTPDGVAAVSLALNAVNLADTAATAGVINFEMNFFQFDLDQIRFFPANMSLATATR